MTDDIGRDDDLFFATIGEDGCGVAEPAGDDPTGDGLLRWIRRRAADGERWICERDPETGEERHDVMTAGYLEIRVSR